MREAVDTIYFGSYNIYNVRNVRLESTLHGISQANMDLDVFQKTKVTGGFTQGSWEVIR